MCDSRLIKMILLLVLYITSTLAYGDQHYRHGLRSENNHLYNTNFSEDELFAINNYKSASNTRHYNTIQDIFDPKLFDNRRIFGWLSQLRKDKNDIAKLPKRSSSKYEELVNDKIFYLRLTKSLTENLTKLTNILEDFTKSLKEKSYLDQLRGRVSRSIKEKVKPLEIKTYTKTIDTKVNSNTDKKETDTSKPPIKIIEETSESVEKLENKFENSGRRTFNSVELKHKLISAINDTLNVIQYKIRSVSNIAEIFGDRLMYKVGYIAGSLTAIKGFIDELQMSVVNNDKELNDKYILDMYDTANKIKESSGTLLDLLHVYVDKTTSELIRN